MNPTPDPAEMAPKKSQGRTLEWLARHPMIGLVGFIVGIVSLLATFYFGVSSQRSRKLLYGIYPTETPIVKSGQSSDLHVLYKGQDVSTDVTAIQVAVWNYGNESIKPDNFVTVPPITLTTSPKVPILEARIMQVQRNVSQIDLDTSHIATGSVSLTWKILEHNDGVLIQLIVGGPPSVTIQAEGVIEGQQKITAYDMRPDTISIQALIAALIGASLFVGGFIYGIREIDKRKQEGRVGWKLQLLAAAGAMVGVALVIMSVSYVFSSFAPPAFR
jgi:hypothetical protein